MIVQPDRRSKSYLSTIESWRLDLPSLLPVYGATDPDPPAQMTMREYRGYYLKKQNKFLKRITRENDMGIEDTITIPRSVDMTEIRGTNQEVAAAIDELYANDGRFFDPEMSYPPSMIDRFGKDYALNAQGIYYYDFYLPELVTCDRKVWVPTFKGIDWEEPGEAYRRQRAQVLAKHNIDNETRKKSEYAWEADAWSDVFSDMRNDPCLEIDKHEYSAKLAKTDPGMCTLTGESIVTKRTPDAVFGLTTFSKRESDLPVWADELRRDRLEKLLLYRKCGLLVDPKWGETDLVFPFAVYEAKGWSGDCREARRQACLAGATYLDMLNDLCRTPGPVGLTKPYQTATSHRYQVFALTSFSAHWHLLVGHRRPRQAEEHAGMKGMSKTVFQRIWSGRVIDEKSAWELLSLVDQIHLWAITDFRTFVLEHLRPWLGFCEENFLLDWDSDYDSGRQRKSRRTYSESRDLLLPRWVDFLSDSLQQKAQVRAREILAKALEEHRLRKGKGKAKRPDGSGFVCMANECSRSQETAFDSDEAFLGHLQSFHDYPKRDLAGIKRRLDQAEERRSSGIPASFIGDDPGPSKRVKMI
ncbi:hypothetical protein FGG08_007239 [Glutinoglossum americanum]|uniref:Uncharacterized protein n=1 Tax=Glutinoglossum americanum TaxID=1670608 RepID=A0A9P8HZA4_9PEZI|nr:hypothetical protein FGG08_007239 [Glutinoglossum americanum]